MNPNETPRCDLCGYLCHDGYERRNRGRHPETDYDDDEIVCSECLQLEIENRYRDEAADAKYDMQEDW